MFIKVKQAAGGSDASVGLCAKQEPREGRSGPRLSKPAQAIAASKLFGRLAPGQTICQYLFERMVPDESRAVCRSEAPAT